jgi:hypothetical protein
VLVLCAPGEQHLAWLAGWNGELTWLSWGWAGLLSLYAGISAVVATIRPRGSRGKATAVVGAGLSLLLAMVAQPVSHLFTTGWMSADPRPPLWLVVSVSSIPPFILGHLLHLAASQAKTSRVRQDKPVPVPDKVSRTFDAPREIIGDKTHYVPVSVPVPVPVTAGPGTVQDTAPVPLSAVEFRDRMPRPAVPARTGQSLGDKQSMSSRALELVREGHDEDTVKEMIRNEFRDKETGRPPLSNSINKAVTRAQDKVSRSS